MLALILSACVCAALASLNDYRASTVKALYHYHVENEMDYVIPDGQCDGYIGQEHLCGYSAPQAVSVEVWDARMPDVHVADSMRNAVVRREADALGRCSGAARVTLGYACYLDKATGGSRRALHGQIELSALHEQIDLSALPDAPSH